MAALLLCRPAPLICEVSPRALGVSCRAVPARHCKWETVERGAWTRSVMRRFFRVDVPSDIQCDLFLIEGVPAASMLYEHTDRVGVPIATGFHINKGLLFLFDAGDTMRAQLFRRYATVQTLNVTNSLEFMQV